MTTTVDTAATPVVQSPTGTTLAAIEALTSGSAAPAVDQESTATAVGVNVTVATVTSAQSTDISGAVISGLGGGSQHHYEAFCRRRECQRTSDNVQNGGTDFGSYTAGRDSRVLASQQALF